METRSKRRRLMVSSYVSSSWPDVPAIFESLNDDTLTTVLEFVGGKSYRSFGGLNKHCKEIYLTTKGMTKETFLYGYGPLSVITDKIKRAGFDCDLFEAVGKGVVFYNRIDLFKWALEVRNEDVLGGICYEASKEGRIDILEEVWNHIEDEDDKRDIFECVHYPAAKNGKLDALKWHGTKEFDIDEEGCAEEAAEGGQLHIIQWLKEERRLELSGELYRWAISGGHLHVMKWLREQKTPFYDSTFRNAAEKGNLDILQWLHDEGCPCPEYLELDEDEANPEVIDWCRMNEYNDRVYRY